MKKRDAEQARVISCLLLGCSLVLAVPYLPSSVQAASPITPSGLNTQVSAPTNLPSGKVQYDITGGTRPGGGTNLFHSFGDFNVPNNNIANFLNDSGLATSNILGRVTGGNISNIFGTIQTTGFGSANLFMMNPMGFLFGPNATVNVGGMVSFTSADYLRLADGVRFNAVPDVAADALLTAAPVGAFGFLGSNPGAITVQGSQFTVTEGKGISLVGGNITVQSGVLDDGVTIQPARLSAPGGQVNIASVASPGEVVAGTLNYAPNVNGQSFGALGAINISQQSVVDVSGNGGGTVRIRGGQFVLENSLLQSNTAALYGGPISITAGSVQMKGGQIQTASLGPAKVGDIQINSSSLSMTDGALIDTLLVPNPLIPGQPGGGTIAITATDSIFVTGQRPGTTNLLPLVPGLPTYTNIPSGIYSENFSANTGSRIVIQTPSLTLQPGLIGSHAFGAGAAGDLSFLLGQLTLKDGGLIGSNAFGAGATGSVHIRASDSITMSGFFPGTFQIGAVPDRNVGSDIANASFGVGQAGPVFVSTPTLTMNGANISSATLGSGGAGDLNVQAGTIILTGGAAINSSTLASGPGGTISVTASEELSISGSTGQSFSFGPETIVNNPSTIVATTFGTGRAGAITVSTPRLTMFDGGLITTATGGDGAAGSIIVNAGSMNLSSGASISSSSGLNIGAGFLFGNGAGGTITVNATGPVTIAGQGCGLFTNTVGNGAGGNINLRGSAIQLSNGASISATSSGRGNAGNITVNAGNQFTMMSSSVTTEANQSSGGTIKISTNPNGTVELTNSTISASVLDGTGGGGSVTIDPQFVLLENSQILANAVFGPGGKIFITTNLLLPDANSIISASSQFGQNGTITIQSPIAPASGKIFPLSQKTLLATSLLTQRCTAQAGGNLSSFTVAGRDSLPAEPSGWLSSPLALAISDSGSSPLSEAGPPPSQSEPVGDTPLISLRRIAPPGFLTQSFAMDWSDCTS